MDIVTLINEIKLKHRMSVSEIAERIGVAPSTLLRYVNGEREGASPRMSTLQALIDLHGGVDDRDVAEMMRGASGYKGHRQARDRLIAARPDLMTEMERRDQQARMDRALALVGEMTMEHAGVVSVPLVRQVFGQSDDPLDPANALEMIPVSQNIARKGSYAVELTGTAPPGSASIYLPAGAKLIIDPSRPCRPGHPVMVRYVREDNVGIVDARAVYMFVSHEGKEGFSYTHASTGETESMPRELYDAMQPVVAILYN